jgi:hypothetical protein
MLAQSDRTKKKQGDPLGRRTDLASRVQVLLQFLFADRTNIRNRRFVSLVLTSSGDTGLMTCVYRGGNHREDYPRL